MALASRALFGGLGKDLAPYNYYDSISRFKFPLLVMHGDGDAVPMEATTKILSTNPNAKIVHFSNSGHFVFIEDPTEFQAAVVSFVKK